MKAISKFLCGAAMFIAATAASATPTSSVTKLAGAGFDIFFEDNNPKYSASLDGTSLTFTLNNFSIATASFSGGPEFMSSMFLVAHEGKAIKSAYGIDFKGGYRLGQGPGSLQVVVSSSVFDADVAEERDYALYHDQVSNLGRYMNISSQYEYRYGALSMAEFDQSLDYKEAYNSDDGKHYDQLAFEMNSQLYAQTGNGGPPVEGWMDEIRFDFQIVDLDIDTPADVPEPAGIALFAIGAAGFAARRRKATLH